jgi:hypothetical protein
MKTRAEHMAWAKQRALEYVEAGDVKNAFASFASDITKHPETASLSEFIGMVGMPELMSGRLDSPEAMRKFIEGFA